MNSTTIIPNLSKQLGKGSFGQVYLSIDEKYAVKVIPKKEGHNVENILLIEITKGNKYLASLYDILEKKEEYHVIMELLSGEDLIDLIIRKNGLHEVIYEDEEDENNYDSEDIYTQDEDNRGVLYFLTRYMRDRKLSNKRHTYFCGGLSISISAVNP